MNTPGQNPGQVPAGPVLIGPAVSPVVTGTGTVAKLTDVRAKSAAVIALIGLVDWMLSTYVFHGTTPPAVAAIVYVVVPAVAAYLATHIALNKIPPNYLAEFRTDKGKAGKDGVAK